MTFEEHLQAAIKRQEEEEQRHVRHSTREAWAVLLPLRDSEQIRDHIRAILQAGAERTVAGNGAVHVNEGRKRGGLV